MTTRRTQDETQYHQNRYASSTEFDRGLLANLVAKRAALVDRREDRELLWTIHFFSHRDGGLKWLANQLMEQFAVKGGTREMVKLGKRSGQDYATDEVKSVRKSVVYDGPEMFLLRGELSESDHQEIVQSKIRLGDICRYVTDDDSGDLDHKADVARLQKTEADARAKAELLPTSYPVGQFMQMCREAADELLERDLKDFCLDPSREFSAFAPWYFYNLVPVLRRFISQWVEQNTHIAETALSRIVAEEFDYTWHSRCLTLLEGEARRGKSFAAKNCCSTNPGRARFVEVPPGSDETSFFRALARGLGLGNLSQYTLEDIRDRVTSLLLTGDFILVLDEAQRLWPGGRQNVPKFPRIDWLMHWANHKVPILLISTPQFMAAQNRAEKAGWNSAQLTGRMENYKLLPSNLADEDLMAIASAFLPEASQDVLKVMAAYARTSARYIAAIETISKRARYHATRAGRNECTDDDVRTAMKESVIPSDNRLKSALEKTPAGTSRRGRHAAALPVPAPVQRPETPVEQPMRTVAPATAAQRGNLTEFVTH